MRDVELGNTGLVVGPKYANFITPNWVCRGEGQRVAGKPFGRDWPFRLAMSLSIDRN